MIFIKKEDIDWKQIKYLKEPLSTSDELATWKYKLWLNEPLASWDVFSYWEKERIASMEKHLNKKDILFDIGTEQGWCNLVYAQIVGPENMVLIEPTQEFWPNIKALWNKNYPNVKPLGFYDGFFSDKTTDKRVFLAEQWPTVSDGYLIDRNKYQYIHANDENVTEVTIDDYVLKTGIVPNAFTIDTEGSELLIFKGAEKTLKENDIKIWVSIHPDLGLRDYKVHEDDTRNYLKSLGYTGEWLATDHEVHEYWSKK